MEEPAASNRWPIRVLTETENVLELQRRVRSQLVGGDWKQALIVSTPESLPGSWYLISFNPHLSKVWISLSFIDWKTGLKEVM